MSAPQQFLVCLSAAHAEIVDQFICAHLRDKDGNLGSCWSGVYAKPGLLADTYGVLWDAPGNEVFGDPAEEGFTVETDTEGEWQLMPQPDPEPSELV